MEVFELLAYNRPGTNACSSNDRSGILLYFIVLGAQTPRWFTVWSGLEWGGNQGETAKGLYYGFTPGAVYSALSLHAREARVRQQALVIPQLRLCASTKYVWNSR